MNERIKHEFPHGYSTALKKVDRIETQAVTARRSLDLYKPKVKVQCTSQVATGKGCGAWTPIRNLVYVQTHWYTHPHGCTGGDYWNEGEGQWKCPKCGHVNRLHESPEIEALKPYFKGVFDTYDD